MNDNCSAGSCWRHIAAVSVFQRVWASAAARQVRPENCRPARIRLCRSGMASFGVLEAGLYLEVPVCCRRLPVECCQVKQGMTRKVAIWPPEAWFQSSVAVLSSTAVKHKSWPGRLLGSHAVINLGLCALSACVSDTTLISREGPMKRLTSKRCNWPC